MAADTRYRALLVVMVLVGMVALTVQTVLLRELMVVSWGNELVFGIGLAFWLTGVFSGALTGSFLVRRREISIRLTIIVVSCLPVLGIGGVTWIRCLHLITGTPAGQLPPYGAVVPAAGLVFLFVAVPVGLTFPFLVALLQQRATTPLTESATPVYVAEALGACMMALLLSMLLLGHFSSLILITGTGLLLIPVMLGPPFRQDRGLVLGVFLTGIALIVLTMLLDGWSLNQRWQSVSAGDRIAEQETPYQLLSLGKLGGQYQLLSNGRIERIFPDRVTERLMAARLKAQCPNADRILIVGPVPRSLSVAMQSAFAADLVSVVLDGQVNRMLDIPVSSSAPADPSCRRITGDIRALLGRPGRYHLDNLDLVVIHGCEPTGTLGNRLLTLEFMNRLSTAMSPEGVLALSLPDTVNYTAGDIAGAGSLITATVQAVFPRLIVVSGSPHWLFASRSGRPLVGDRAEVVSRIRTLGPDWHREALMVGGEYQPDRMAQVQAAMIGRERELNRDDRPILLNRYARLTGWYASGGMSVLLDILTRLPWIWIGLPLMLMGIGFSGGKAVRLFMPVGIMGFVAMAMVLVLVYLFQVEAGSVYRQIALLSGLFMAGLPLGAWLVRKRQSVVMDRPVFSLRVPLLLMMTILAALLLCWHGGIMHPVLLFSISGCSGIAAGTIFPVAMSHVQQQQRDVPVASGLVDAFDHLGGAVGALLVTAFMIPALGVTGTLLLLIAVSGVGLLVLPSGH